MLSRAIMFLAPMNQKAWCGNNTGQSLTNCCLPDWAPDVQLTIRIYANR